MRACSSAGSRCGWLTRGEGAQGAVAGLIPQAGGQAASAPLARCGRHHARRAGRRAERHTGQVRRHWQHAKGGAAPQGAGRLVVARWVVVAPVSQEPCRAARLLQQGGCRAADEARVKHIGHKGLRLAPVLRAGRIRRRTLRRGRRRAGRGGGILNAASAARGHGAGAHRARAADRPGSWCRAQACTATGAGCGLVEARRQRSAAAISHRAPGCNFEGCCPPARPPNGSRLGGEGGTRAHLHSSPEALH